MIKKEEHTSALKNIHAAVVIWPEPIKGQEENS